MKCLLFLAALLAGPSLPAQQDSIRQIFADLQRKDFNWQPHERSRDPQDLRKVIADPRFVSDCAPDEPDDDPAFQRRIHWVDLNQDGRDDLIYSGPCKPYRQVEIFLAQGSFYQYAFGGAGEVIDIEFLKDKTLLKIRMYGCCCVQYDIIRTLEFAKNDTTWTLAAQTTWFSEMPVETPAFYQPFSALKSLAVRLEAKIDNKIREWECSDENKVKGNVVAEFSKGAQGVAVKKKQIAGATWYFVVMLPQARRVPSEFEAAPEEAERTYVLGWVKGDELEWRK